MNIKIVENPFVIDGQAPETGLSVRASCPICCGAEGAQKFLVAPDRFHGRKRLYQLVRCSSCSLVWLDNPPRPDEMSAHYSADYDKKIAEGGEGSLDRWKGHRERLLKYKSSGAILDLGCSSGSFLGTIGEGWELYGVEMSAEMGKRAKLRCGANIFVGDILDAPFPPGIFDAITCFHVFEHLYQPREVLARVSAWLKPGGIFYTLMPNIDSAAVRIFKSYWYGLELPRHLYHFSPKSLVRLTESVGLRKEWLFTDREVCFERSTRYMVDDLLARVGIMRVPSSQALRPSLARKAVNRMFRMTVEPTLKRLMSLVGDGESISAVFRKDKPESSHAPAF